MEIRNVNIVNLAPNPYRDMVNYPVIRAKVDALKASIADVGMWPSIIGRAAGGKTVEKAFGHHRELAAIELGLTEIPVIMQDLSDRQMLQYMGRENGEDYASDVAISLNTWEAGVRFLGKGATDANVAQLLGWTEADGQPTMLARTCRGAMRLIAAGEMSREDISGIPVSAAFNVVERVISRIEAVDRRAKATGNTAAENEAIKKRYVEAGKKTIADVRGGHVAARDVRGRVDENAFVGAKGTKSELPIFRTFGRDLSQQIYRMLRTDGLADKLEQVAKSLPQITLDSDKQLVRTLQSDLHGLADRAGSWERRLAMPANTQSRTAIGRSA